MEPVFIYGIKNCDTMKKTFTWLQGHCVPYTFHDYKKEGIDQKALEIALDQCGWETVINKRGTTWRKLPDEAKNNMDKALAIQVATENPSIVKRPLIIHKEKALLGFNVDIYSEIFRE
ncbi:MAG: ArsC family reductase [Alphaproteobacteria bacterium]|nr:ArsC family reductase [Alphaproteobacteria bacterium]